MNKKEIIVKNILGIAATVIAGSMLFGFSLAFIIDIISNQQSTTTTTHSPRYVAVLEGVMIYEKRGFLKIEVKTENKCRVLYVTDIEATEKDPELKPDKISLTKYAVWMDLAIPNIYDTPAAPGTTSANENENIINNLPRIGE